MSHYLNPGKNIILTRHLLIKWADRIAASRTLGGAAEDSGIVSELKSVIKNKNYKLVNDGEEFNGKKYRMVCEIGRKAATLVVIDAKQALVFKSVWESKAWEKKYLKEVK